MRKTLHDANKLVDLDCFSLRKLHAMLQGRNIISHLENEWAPARHSQCGFKTFNHLVQSYVRACMFSVAVYHFVVQKVQPAKFSKMFCIVVGSVFKLICNKIIHL